MTDDMRQYVGIRSSAIDTQIWNTLDEDDPRNFDEDISPWDLLGTIEADDMYALLEQAYDVGYKIGTADDRRRAL